MFSYSSIFIWTQHSLLVFFTIVRTFQDYLFWLISWSNKFHHQFFFPKNVSWKLHFLRFFTFENIYLLPLYLNNKLTDVTFLSHLFFFLLKFVDFVTRLSETGCCYGKCEAKLILYFLLELTCFILDAWITLVLSVICNRLIRKTVLIVTFFSQYDGLFSSIDSLFSSLRKCFCVITQFFFFGPLFQGTPIILSLGYFIYLPD